MCLGSGWDVSVMCLFWVCRVCVCVCVCVVGYLARVDKRLCCAPHVRERLVEGRSDTSRS